MSRQNSLRDRLRHKALERELKRIRELLELDGDAYSDLMVLQKARRMLQELNELESDDDLEELLEDELIEDAE